MAGLGSRPPQASGGLGLEASLAMRYGKVQKAKRPVVQISPGRLCIQRIRRKRLTSEDTMDIAASCRFYPASIRTVLGRVVSMCIYEILVLSVGAAN